jgi:alpha-galactosidase
VEVPGQISGFGVSGIGVGTLPDGIAGVLRQRVYQQELTVDAALSGSRELAIQALLADPLMAQVSVEDAAAMLDEAQAEHADRAARFAAARVA